MSDNIDMLLDIDSLLADGSNHQRHQRMMVLWSKARETKKHGNVALADRLKAAGNRLRAKNENRPAQREAHLSVTRRVAGELLSVAPFQNRKFSNRTIQALIDCSIDAPERLLFMTEEQIESIPGVGKVSLGEIRAYRQKYIR
jgi:DNA-directed RNA polymerase alpha subunit